MSASNESYNHNLETRADSSLENSQKKPNPYKSIARSFVVLGGCGIVFGLAAVYESFKLIFQPTLDASDFYSAKVLGAAGVAIAGGGVLCAYGAWRLTHPLRHSNKTDSSNRYNLNSGTDLNKILELNQD